MKKIISLLLCMTLIIAFPAVMSAQEIDETDKMHEIVTVLTKLGIVDGTASDSDMSALVTRAEFVSYAAALIKLEGVTDRRYFNDVPADHWALGSINSMVGIGAVSLADDGNFNPDNKVTYEQACKILMVTAGYREYASPGYTLADYVQLAYNAGVGITYGAGDELTFGAVLEMLYNTLTAEIAKYNPLTNEEHTVLSMYYSGYTATGTVDSIYGTEKDEKVYKEEQAYISGELFTVSDDVNLEKYFGETVKFTFIEDKQDGTKEIIYAKSKYKNASTEIQSNLIRSFDKSTGALSYYTSENAGRGKTTVIPKSAVVIYNGALMQGVLSDKISEFINGSKKGLIKLVESDGSGIDTVIIKSYDTYIAKAYDTEDNILYNEHDKNKNINIDEFDVVRIRSRYEDNVSLPKVFPDALSIAVSDDNRILEIYITEEYQRCVNARTEETVTLDGEQFDLDKFIDDKFRNVLGINETVKVKADIFGDIVYAEKLGETTGFQVGYLTKMRFNEDESGEFLSIRVFGKNKEFSSFDIREKVAIDGIRYKADDVRSIAGAFPGKNSYDGAHKIIIEPQLIRFKVNDRNVVKEIDTYNVGPSEDKNYTLTRTSDGETAMRYWAEDKRYGELDVVDSDTLVLRAPKVDVNGLVTVGGAQVEPTDSMYSVGATVYADYEYYVEAYYYTNRFIADAIIVKSRKDKELDTLFMFDELVTVWDASAAELKMQCVGYSKSGKVTYTLFDDELKESLEGLKRGDIIRVGTLQTDSSIITSFKKLFDAETMSYVGSSGTTEHLYQGSSLRSTYNLAKMYAYDTRKNILRGSYKLFDAAEDIANMALNTGNTAIIIYDKELKNDNIFEGTVNDIRTYKMYGEECDLVLYNTSGITSPVMFVVRR